MSGGCPKLARKCAGDFGRPQAEILASGAAQLAASSRPLPGAVTALLLYDRYFSGENPAGERVSRHTPQFAGLCPASSEALVALAFKRRRTVGCLLGVSTTIISE